LGTGIKFCVSKHIYW